NTLYGTATSGGSHDSGAIFSLAMPPLTITTLSSDSTNLLLQATYGFAGETYNALTSTNLALPIIEWTPAGSATASSNGDFSIIVSNAVNTAIPGKFYILERN